MSTTHEQGTVFYVVSRSGKVLESEDRHRRLVGADYFEGELEGWIFWGSSKRSNGGICSKGCQQDAPASESTSKFDCFDWTTRNQRIPFVVWGHETEAHKDVFPRVSWTEGRSYGRKSAARTGFSQGRRNVEIWENMNARFESSIPRTVQPQVILRSERWYRMEQNLSIGLSQLAVLQKWEPGTRELAAKWAAWLLKMLRKSRPHPRPLQHLLFTMCSAVLPVFCCSLDREQWTGVPDPELCKCVDIVWNALDKSHAFFSPAQWEILEERLIECRQLRMKVAGLAENDTQVLIESLEISQCKRGTLPKSGMSSAPDRVSRGSLQPSYVTSDEQLSNNLVRTDGVGALVQRALKEKLFTPLPKHLNGEGGSGFSGGSGTIVSLVCPLKGSRVKIPARARGCSHLSSFDLQEYLERHAREDSPTCSSTHQRKKSKTNTQAWRCPICGSDATWPQIIVDRLLLRILEVLPEHMPQVCLLPNGRWRVVWSTFGEDPGKMDQKSTQFAVHPPSKSSANSQIHHMGQFEDWRHDAKKKNDCWDGQEESCGCCGRLQMFDRAYKGWKDEVDDLGNGGTGEQIEVQWCAESTVAVWTGGDHNSNMDSFCRASPQDLINLEEDKEKVSKEIIDSGGITKPEICSSVCGELAMISGARDGVSKQREGEDDDARISSRSKLILEALQSLGGITSVCNGTGGMYARMRIGQHKARRKLMAKKT